MRQKHEWDFDAFQTIFQYVPNRVAKEPKSQRKRAQIAS